MRNNLIFKRDNYTCQSCGSTEYLVTHHINYSHKDSSEYNEITLCGSCNTRAGGKNGYSKDFWMDYFRLKILEIYMFRHWASVYPDKPVIKLCGTRVMEKPSNTDPYLNSASYFPNPELPQRLYWAVGPRKEKKLRLRKLVDHF